jgi:regulator of sirC expression with transglutaminase-like and TPR domain
MRDRLLDEFVRVARQGDLAGAALVFARVEYPALSAAPYLERLDEMGREVRARLDMQQAAAGRLGVRTRVDLLSHYLFDEQKFSGNRDAYDDPRNSYLNEVLDRGLGIPITLGLVYMEVARRAGFRVDGVNFPGHFLLSCPGEPAGPDRAGLILDPFDGGAVLDEFDCRRLLHEHVGEDLSFDPGLLAPASSHQILSRMLVNLKLAYVAMRSYPQARDVTELLLAIDPTAFNELRDRGLLAYQLNDFASALRDLERYLRFTSGQPPDGQGNDEQDQVWEYVKALRKRVASYN